MGQSSTKMGGDLPLRTGCVSYSCPARLGKTHFWILVICQNPLVLMATWRNTPGSPTHRFSGTLTGLIIRISEQYLPNHWMAFNSLSRGLTHTVATLGLHPEYGNRKPFIKLCLVHHFARVMLSTTPAKKKVKLAKLTRFAGFYLWQISTTVIYFAQWHTYFVGAGPWSLVNLTWSHYCQLRGGLPFWLPHKVVPPSDVC